LTTVNGAKFIRRPDTWLWDMLGGSYDIPMDWFGCRFHFLKVALEEGKFRRDAAIMPELGKRSKLASVEISGGRDLKYVIVYAREVPDNWQPGIQETLVYRRDVAGTDLVYDVSGEFMQGKARPYECDLRKLPLRIYAVLPFQVEKLDLAIQQRVEIPAVRLQDQRIFGLWLKTQVQLLDAAGEAIAGKFPIAVEFIRRQSRDRIRGFSLVDAETGGPTEIGTAIKPEGAGQWEFAVRSLLTGDEVTLPFSLVSVTGDPAKEIRLTSEGLTRRHAPQPVQLDNR
jgi:hypothetical protein